MILRDGIGRIMLIAIILIYSHVSALYRENVGYSGVDNISSPEKKIDLVAVSEDGECLVLALKLRIIKGSGNVFISTNIHADPLTLQSFNNAAIAGSNLAGINKTNYDFIFTFETKLKKIKGPSAGLSAAVLVYSVLKHKNIKKNVILTGSIDRFGNVGIVGNIPQKLEKASMIGADLFIMPVGERLQRVRFPYSHKITPDYIVYREKAVETDIIKYARDVYNIDVVEIAHVKEALSYVIESGYIERIVPYQRSAVRYTGKTPTQKAHREKSGIGVASPDIVSKYRGIIEDICEEKYSCDPGDIFISAGLMLTFISFLLMLKVLYK